MLYKAILYGTDGSTHELTHDDEPQGLVDFVRLLVDDDDIESLTLTHREGSLITFERTRPQE